MRFIDAWDFDVRAIKKSCVHIVHKDGRIIPFETMNLFYRDEKETRLTALQEMHETLPGKNKLKVYE
jgi:7,8-dihydro-6-hydroxymethylpterin dimethyltransferase